MSVYFVTCRQVNAVKIGSSVEPHARLGEIQWGCPLPLKLEEIMPGEQEEEFRLHRWFSEERIHGEWFTISEEIERLIASNPAPPAPDHNRVKRQYISLNSTLKREARARAASEAARPKLAFDSRLLGREHRKRLASGDIHFPFRGKP